VSLPQPHDLFTLLEGSC